MPDTRKTAAEVQITEQNQFTQELKLADKLAIERTVLAADRTMLAGVRTSMALIGFGFTIFNILKYVRDNSSKVIMRPHTPRNMGGFLLLVGTIPLLVMIVQYSRTLKRMGKIESLGSNPNFQMAVAILLLGTFLLITLLRDILLF